MNQPSIPWRLKNPSLTAIRKVLVEACSFYNKMYAHLKQHSKQKTRERNSKQVLVEQEKWIEIDELVAATEKEYQEVIKLEGRSRMPPASSCHSNSQHPKFVID
jgi:hypothetical protein